MHDRSASEPERSKSGSAPTREPSKDPSETSSAGSLVGPASGIALVDRMARDGEAVQFEARAGAPRIAAGDLRHRVAEGFSGHASSLPHLARIQQAFGEHGRELGRVKAHVGGPAAAATHALGASAYASGGSIAFASSPSLRTAAHEAAHVVQQRAGVVEGVGSVGDVHERQADEVADAVVAGKSAASLFGAAGGGEVPSVQRSMLPSSGPLSGPPSLIDTENVPHDDAKAKRAAELAAKAAAATRVTGDKESKDYFSQIGLREVGDAYVWSVPHLAVDKDGAPNTYHPPVAGTPSGRISYPGGRKIIDHIGNATNAPDHPPYLDDKGNVQMPEWDTVDPKTKKTVHHKTRWVGVLLDKHGKPVVQGDSDPYPGAYISQSTLRDDRFDETKPAHYADATVIPYVALPGHINSQTRAGTGDLAVVVMLADPGPKPKASPTVAFGIVGDVAPRASQGEASGAMCAALGVPSGITEKNAKFLWIVFPHSRETDATKTGWWKDVGELQKRAKAKFEAWGGLELVMALQTRTRIQLPPNVA